ncbi:MAG: tetratricopeptide repeat protein [Planctomycetota bacterium]|jgi:hypothetical protein
MTSSFEPEKRLTPDAPGDRVSDAGAPLVRGDLPQRSVAPAVGKSKQHPYKVILGLALLAGAGLFGLWWASGHRVMGPTDAAAETPGPSVEMLVMPSGDAWAPGEYGAAVSENPAQEVSPASNAAFERGRSLLAMGQSEEAMVHLRSAIESEPDHVEAHYRLGLAAYQAGDMDTLREQAEILRGLNRSYASMLSNLH